MPAAPDMNTIAAGGDIKLSERVLVGAAFGYSDNDGDFGGSSGGYKLKETTGTAYVGYGGGPWYVGATLGAGDLDYNDVSATFSLGALNRTESGDARRLAHDGQRARRVLVQLRATGCMARSCASRIRKSTSRVSPNAAATARRSSTVNRSASRLFRASAGRSAGRVANVRPFARVSWEIESKDDERFVSASSVTLGGTYSMPTIKPDNNYLQYLLGASADFGRVTGYVAGSATSGRSDGNGYGITVGVRVPL